MFKRLLLLGLLVAVGYLVWRATQPHTPPVVVDPPSVSSTLVYFCKKTGNASQVVPVERKAQTRNNGVERLTWAMQQLINGPTPHEAQQGIYTELPKTLRLRGVTPKGHTLQVDVSGEFAQGGGSDSMTQRLEQVIQTAVKAAPDVPVYLLMDGKPLNVLGGEGLEVPQPLKLTSEPT